MKFPLTARRWVALSGGADLFLAHPKVDHPASTPTEGDPHAGLSKETSSCEGRSWERGLFHKNTVRSELISWFVTIFFPHIKEQRDSCPYAGASLLSCHYGHTTKLHHVAPCLRPVGIPSKSVDSFRSHHLAVDMRTGPVEITALVHIFPSVTSASSFVPTLPPPAEVASVGSSWLSSMQVIIGSTSLPSPTIML
jgi:hypothetical protein